MEKPIKEEEIIKGLNIYEKMSLITDEIGVVLKNLKVQVNKTSSYKAVSERDVLDKVKPIEKKYRVYSYPYDREIIDKDTLVKESEYNGNITKTNTLFMRLQTIYRFVNIDNPSEFIDIDTYGDGLDTGDKASGKAMTYADKYALMKAYKISTGDDPDQDPSPENGYKKQSKTIRKPDDEVNELLTKQFNDALIKSGLELEKVLGRFTNENGEKITNYNLLTEKQRTEAIILMKKYAQKNILEEAEEQLKEEQNNE